MNLQQLRVIYAGTPAFAVPPLLQLHAAGAQIVAVYTQPDRPSGRGRKLMPSAVKEAALELALPLRQPLNFRELHVQQELADSQADVMIVAAYGLLLPLSILSAPRLGCINIHASLLPRWRGAAPIQRAIEAGDAHSGVSIMQMAQGLDTGGVWLRRECAINADTTAETLHDELSSLGAQALLDALPAIVTSLQQPQPQDETQTCYARKISKREALIDWTQPAPVLERKIRAFNAWPVAQSQVNDATLRIWQAEVATEQHVDGRHGQIVDTQHGLDVVTGQGLLRLHRVQLAGKKPISARELLNSKKLVVGDCFG